ncbi:sugar/nucleoside kinase (ribokinase family) [Krasilnikovia cinnamomea]|uniref:Sugar/nucleoside kinase (Ribokinase family) n=1 Tax=Krasilnikovia cinnamomea TaxID=349313 RepID=A0A4Q7ZSR1_9ACTN|nr:PfkB family carbohydrate kinase [Krasilnikovia cinnamomea]RZU54237.1 sugar/nucleoside kinase (ribokinase family) [Krasilnikovia cinnamomea]
MHRVLVAGPASWNVLIHVADLPAPQPHTLFAEWHHDTLGGTSAGKALNLARLGVHVTLQTLVGADDEGRRITAELSGHGIDVRAVPSGNGSERHVNLMDRLGRRLSVYLTLPGPAHEVTVAPGLIEDADAVVADLADHARPVLRAARRAGKPIWCDLHDYDGTSEFHREFRDAADYLFLSGERLDDPEAFLRARAAAGATVVVCTQGADGAIACTRDGSIVRVPATPAGDVVDTNGAGDAFFAGFLAAHLGGAPLAECLRQASRAGATAVRSRELAAATLTPALLRADTPLT